MVAQNNDAMLDYYVALDLLLHNLPERKETEYRSLSDAMDLVMAEDVPVLFDIPSFDNSAMDGYALGGDVRNRKIWKIIDRIAAGDTPSTYELRTGEASRIFTGAPVPKGTTTIVIQENIKISGNEISVLNTVPSDQHIRRKGEEFKAGDILLKARTRLTPASIALLASQGYLKVKVFKPLKIYIFSTGNELTDPGKTLSEGRIYDSNRFLLLSWLKNKAFDVIDGGILPDEKDQVERALYEASQKADVILTSGGVSVGEEDHLKRVLIKLGKLNFWKLAIKPGKPFTWGEIGASSIFMLPGNPVSSLVTFQQLVCPALRVLMGEEADKALPKPFSAKASFSQDQKQIRREFIRITLEMKDGELFANAIPRQGSAMLSSCTNAHALAEIPPNTIINRNDLIRIYPLNYKV